MVLHVFYTSSQRFTLVFQFFYYIYIYISKNYNALRGSYTFHVLIQFTIFLQIFQLWKFLYKLNTYTVCYKLNPFSLFKTALHVLTSFTSDYRFSHVITSFHMFYTFITSFTCFYMHLKRFYMCFFASV